MWRACCRTLKILTVRNIWRQLAKDPTMIKMFFKFKVLNQTTLLKGQIQSADQVVSVSSLHRGEAASFTKLNSTKWAENLCWGNQLRWSVAMEVCHGRQKFFSKSSQNLETCATPPKPKCRWMQMDLQSQRSATRKQHWAPGLTLVWSRRDIPRMRALTTAKHMHL